MEQNIFEIAQRIKVLREILDYSPEELANAAGVSLSDYEKAEGGEFDFSFTFLYRVAKKLDVDIVELLTGENPRLSGHTVTRAEGGIPIKRREGFQYLHLAGRFKNKTSEPFLVTAPYSENAENGPITLSYHDGQEFDYIISGKLKIEVDGHTEYLEAGDSIYYDSGKGHGMVAAGGQPCVFLAIIMEASKGQE